jgi:site-specific recombinase XerD
MSTDGDNDGRQLALLAPSRGPLAPASPTPPGTPAPAAAAHDDAAPALVGEIVERPPARFVAPDDNPATVYLATLAASSRRTMRQALSVIASILTDDQEHEPARIVWAAVGYAHAQHVRAELVRRYQPATVNRMLAAFRRVMRECWHLHQITHEQYADAARVEDLEYHALPAGRALPEGEVIALFDRCTAHPNTRGVRDAAIFSCMYPGGLRRAEVAKLNVSDYDRAAGELRVDGKRNKKRIVPLEGGARDALDWWLDVRGVEPAGELFPAISRTGRILYGRRLSTTGIAFIVDVRAKQARLSHVRPHDLRRTTATNMYERGVDGSTISGHLGHADEKTTRRYNRQIERAKRTAVARLHVPVRRPG